ncbi:MAG: hypothetical protein LBM96_04855 [Methanobrevibacter sp.]|jgi:hypothetical protein|nr:hypothetical protein [Candidatus Methanoflexus mossambicus]
MINKYTFEEFKKKYKEEYEQEKSFWNADREQPLSEFDVITETTDNLEEDNFYTYFIGNNTVIEITKEGDKYSYNDFFNENGDKL